MGKNCKNLLFPFQKTTLITLYPIYSICRVLMIYVGGGETTFVPQTGLSTGTQDLTLLSLNSQLQISNFHFWSGTLGFFLQISFYCVWKEKKNLRSYWGIGSDTPPTVVFPSPPRPRCRPAHKTAGRSSPRAVAAQRGPGLRLPLRRQAATAGVAQLFECGNDPSSQLRLPHLPPPSSPSLPSAAPDAAAATSYSSSSQPPASLARSISISSRWLSRSRRRPWQSRHRKAEAGGISMQHHDRHRRRLLLLQYLPLRGLRTSLPNPGGAHRAHRRQPYRYRPTCVRKTRITTTHIRCSQLH